MEEIEKENKEFVTKKEYDFPQTLKTTIDKFRFAWVIQDALNELIRELTGDEAAIAEQFMYVVGSHTTKYLVREDFSYAVHEYKRGGFPVRYYSLVPTEDGSEQWELKGFVFIPKDDLDDISVDGGDIEYMAESVISNDEDDINFNLMIQTF